MIILLQTYLVIGALYTLVAGFFNAKLKNSEHWAGVLVSGITFWPILLTINLIKMRGNYVRKLRKEPSGGVNA